MMVWPHHHFPPTLSSLIASYNLFFADNLLVGYSCQAAMAYTIEEVDSDAQHQPDHKADPGNQWQIEHQTETDQHSEDRDHGHSRRTEGALHIGLRSAQDQDTSRDQDKGQKGTNIDQFSQITDGCKGRDESYNHAGQDADAIGRTKTWMHPCEP